MSNTLANYHNKNDNSYNLYKDYNKGSIAIQDLGTRHRQWSLYEQDGRYNEISNKSPVLFLTQHLSDTKLIKLKVIGIDFRESSDLWDIIIEFIKQHPDFEKLEFLCCKHFNDDMWNQLYNVLVKRKHLRKFTINCDYTLRRNEMSDNVYQKYTAYFYRKGSKTNFRLYDRSDSPRRLNAYIRMVTDHIIRDEKLPGVLF